MTSGGLSAGDSSNPTARLDVAVVCLFPELFEPFLSTSFVGRARELGLLRVHLEALRQHGVGRYQAVDDTPYGGGSGMVLRVDTVMAAIESAEANSGFGRTRRVLLTPQGAPFRQPTARRFCEGSPLMFVCGRYEGFDERVRQFVDEEASLGDFVITGGEVAAMAMLEACVRLVPGVLGNQGSVLEESFSESQAGQLEYPQYTRPVEYRGLSVPEVLRSGNHGKIEQWRREQSEQRTRQRRPDLLDALATTPSRGLAVSRQPMPPQREQE